MMSSKFLAIVALSALAACSAAARPSMGALDQVSAPSTPTAPLAEAPPPSAQANASVVAPAPRYQQTSCDIRTTPTRHGVQIEGVVHAARAVSGEYELVIAKGGGAGASDIRQGGPFTASAGQSVTLSSSEISVERGGHYRATLTLRDAHGVEICRRSISA